MRVFLTTMIAASLPATPNCANKPVHSKQIEARVERARTMPVTETLQGHEVVWMAPAGEVEGVLVLFHGGGGDGHFWFDHPDGRAFIDRALQRDLLVMSPTSLNRVDRQWDNRSWPDNPDINGVAMAFEQLEALGIVEEDVPHYGLGMSNGGSFVSLAGPGLGLDAIAIYSAAGAIRILGPNPVPTVFVYSPTDEVIDLPMVERNIAAMGTTGVPVEVHNTGPVQMPARRLSRVGGVVDPQAVFKRLVDAGLLTPAGAVAVDPKSREFKVRFGAMDLPSGVSIDALTHALKTGWGGHAFNADFVEATLDFFERQARRRSES